MTSEDKTTFDSALEMIIKSMKENISNELFWQTEMQDIGFGINCNVVEYKNKINSILTMYFCNITAVDRAIRLSYFLHEISRIHLGNNDFAKYYVYKMLNLYKDNAHISMLQPIIGALSCHSENNFKYPEKLVSRIYFVNWSNGLPV
jgi:hypothetical protein